MVEKDGNKLLSTYQNIYTPFTIYCSKCDQEDEILYREYSLWHACHKCKVNKNKYTYDYVKTFIEADGHKLLTTEYKNSHSPLDIQCYHCNNTYTSKFVYLPMPAQKRKLLHVCPKQAIYCFLH